MDNQYDYLKALKWKLYLWILRVKLFWNDILIEWYHRWYLGEKVSMNFNFHEL